jgi:putative transposase
LRNELLNETLFTTLARVRVVLAEWRDGYRTVRPHSKLGGLTPAEIAIGNASTKERQPQGLYF